MTPEKFRLQLEDNFPFEPTDSQRTWFKEVADFILSKFTKHCFSSKGYAGTGKTTLNWVFSSTIKAMLDIRRTYGSYRTGSKSYGHLSRIFPPIPFTNKFIIPRPKVQVK